MTFEAAHAEDRRQAVHVAMGGFALLLPYLHWYQAVLLASLAVLFNLFAVQKVFGIRVFRPGERLRRLSSGIVLYPLCVLGLLLLFADRLDIVAGAWGILAAGDGCATIVGRRFPLARIPWNVRKSLGGSLAFAGAGAAAGAFLTWWCRGTVMPPAYSWYPFVGPVLAAVVAAAVETIPVALDDNISVAGSAAATLWAVSLVSQDAVFETLARGLSMLPAAIVLNGIVAALGYRAGTVTVPGAICGAILGTAIFIAAGWAGWGLLFATFACAVISSRMGLRRKILLGISEGRGGRRGAGNALANTGVAAVAALLSVLTYAQDAALVAFVAALTAGGSDTVASEIGKAWGRTTWLVTTFGRVPAGTDGAMSVEGTAAGLLAAILLAAGGVAGGLVAPAAMFAVVAGATAGSLAESIMGATLEPRGIVNNDVLNFLNTGIAAWAAVLLWALV
jgi:uncharacterized protein (TIGR00297 family)